ncbi:Xaa-Pro aminopeptidase [hydrothermal vent metagenome]|uniref:Xaa-Pro aminopeptidase n=1 Tax=hydrothermal vent metagenome TaxID=652676 RepID=A0A3B0U5F3_9ZZZZ
MERDPGTSKFQSFEQVSNPADVAARVGQLRKEIAKAELDGFLIPHNDAHGNESLPDSEKRLAFITGFTGSAGSAIVGKDKAGLFVDGRYTLQAPAQSDTEIFEIFEAPKASPADWIVENLARDSKIGFDPWLTTPGEIRTIKTRLSGHADLVAHENLVDLIWSSRPPAPTKPLEILNVERTGIAAPEKIANLQKSLKTANASALILTTSDSICWLFNIRGRDVPNTPLVLAFAIVPQSGKPSLFVDPKKLNAAQNRQLSQFIEICVPEDFAEQLTRLGKNKRHIWVDPASCPYAIISLLNENGASLIEKTNPVLRPKAIKNPVEIAGMKKAHRLDGTAMARFLSWFDHNGGAGDLSEIDIAIALENFRSKEPSLVDISFDTISGSGPNGAIVHYRVTKKSNRILKPGELMLVDSGGQYLSGTTDITRTLFCASATDEQKDRYTRVLKGMIAISMVQFPQGTTGAQIDILARQALWQVGLNYSHGTGHGVGAFLNVHEGPAGIAPRYHVPLEAGMILSNEPGFYLEGEYGIRIENLVTVINSPHAAGFLAFETLTLAPIDKRLIKPDLLNEGEINWLNAYHQRVYDQISPALGDADKDWLKQATAAL